MKKCVFITGGTVGTGYATAEKFAQAGYGVFIASRSAERAQEAADKLAAAYAVHTKGYGLGIRDEEAVKAVFADIRSCPARASECRSRWDRSCPPGHER